MAANGSGLRWGVPSQSPPPAATPEAKPQSGLMGGYTQGQGSQRGIPGLSLFPQPQSQPVGRPQPGGGPGLNLSPQSQPGGGPRPQPGGGPSQTGLPGNGGPNGTSPYTSPGQFGGDDPMLEFIAPYAGGEYTDRIVNAAGRGANQMQRTMRMTTEQLRNAARQTGRTLQQVMQDMGMTADDIAAIDTELGGAFDTSGAQDAVLAAGEGMDVFNTVGQRRDIRQAADQLGAFDTTGAQAALGGIDTDFGSAFNTGAVQGDLRGMDYAGIQSRYESDYVDGMVDPTLDRMREDEARRLAQLEASSAAIGGGSNTRMAVEMARTTDEGMRSRAETEANLRNQALRQGQELGLQEAGMRGQFSEAAAQLGLSESELAANIAERQAQMQSQLATQGAELGMSEQEQANRAAQLQTDFANTRAQLGLAESDQARTVAMSQAQLAADAAQLGLSESELAANIAERQAQLGLTQAEARQSVLRDVTATAGANFGVRESLADMRARRAQMHQEAARTRLAGLGIGLEQAELERQIQTDINQTPLTLENWYRGITSTPLASPLPGGETQTQSGGGPGLGTQLLGAGTSLLGAFLQSSDENVKTDIEPLGGALDIIRRQRPSSYAYTDAAYDRVPIEGRRSAGLMAQDLEDIPGAVVQNEHGFKMVDPYPVIATIAAAVQELDRKMEGLAHGG